MKGNRKILHVMGLDKFIPAFIDLIEENFDFSRHGFFIMGNDARYPVRKRANVLFMHEYASKWRALLALIREMNAAEKIILHGLFSFKIVLLLFVQPWLLRKCYWVMWGGDLYAYQSGERNWRWHIKEFFRRPVIRNMGHLVTYVSGDVALARQWYGAKGEYCECIAYPSNIYRSPPVASRSHDGLNILIGNSADPSNQHLEILQKLLPYKGTAIRVYAPLSYGDAAYAEQVIEAGRSMFGEQFIPMRDFMAFDQYMDFLAEIDIAVFNHRRQQAMGNILTLIGMGKTVYMRSDISSWQTLVALGIEAKDVEALSMQLLPEGACNKNQLVVRHSFSSESLVAQWRTIFEG